MTKAEVNVSRETLTSAFSSSSDTRCFPVFPFRNRLFSACRFSSLSDHAARQSGSMPEHASAQAIANKCKAFVREIREDDFSLTSQDACAPSQAS